MKSIEKIRWLIVSLLLALAVGCGQYTSLSTVCEQQAITKLVQFYWPDAICYYAGNDVVIVERHGLKYKITVRRVGAILCNSDSFLISEPKLIP